jgi:hypothetical protein
MGLHSGQQFLVHPVLRLRFTEGKRRVSASTDDSFDAYSNRIHLSLDSMHCIGHHQHRHTKTILGKNTTVQLNPQQSSLASCCLGSDLRPIIVILASHIASKRFCIFPRKIDFLSKSASQEILSGCAKTSFRVG